MSRDETALETGIDDKCDRGETATREGSCRALVSSISIGVQTWPEGNGEIFAGRRS